MVVSCYLVLSFEISLFELTIELEKNHHPQRVFTSIYDISHYIILNVCRFKYDSLTLMLCCQTQWNFLTVNSFRAVNF